MQSCIYEGQVRHRRYNPKYHKFSYKLFYVYLDLDEIDSVFNKRWFWSGKFPALARFNRKDYLGDPNTDLKTAVLDTVEKKTGQRPGGPVRLLTHLRYFGYIFNPVSFYYCFDRQEQHIEAIVAEITNTPWGDRHCYVLNVSDDFMQKSHMRFKFNKDFHISPFMPMELHYDWRFTNPGELLTVHMNNNTADAKMFDATLSLKKKSFNAINCARVLTLYPFMTMKVISGIYWQAFLLFLKRVPFFSHPAKQVTTIDGGAKQAN